MKQIYSKQTLVFLYALHVIPAVYFIIDIPFIIAACGLVECLWWQQLQIQLFPLLAVVIPFIALYLQQKGKFYAGYLFVLNLVYYVMSLFQQGLSVFYHNLGFLFTFFSIALISTQGYLLFKTTTALLNKQATAKKSKKVSSYKDIITIAGIIVLVLILLRLFIYTPIPSSESDCVKITDQEDADSCYINLAGSTSNSELCSKVTLQSSMDECYNTGKAEDCAKIKVNRDAMVGCFYNAKLWKTASSDYCDTAINPGLCNFGLAIWKGDLGICTKADEKEVCEIIVKSSKNICGTFNENCEPAPPEAKFSYGVPAKETVDIDPAQCEKIIFSQSYRDQCLTASAYHSKNTNVCSSISDERQKWVCIIGSTASPESCSSISKNKKIATGDHYSLVRDECFLSLALRTKDISICNQDSDDHESAWCINNIVSRYGADPDKCAAIPEGSLMLGFSNKRAACYNGLAHFKNDPKLCALIPVDYVRADCIGSIGTIEDCDSIPKDEGSEDSQYYVRDSCITAIINRDPNVDYCNHSASTEGFNSCVDLTARITGDKEICTLIENQQLREVCIEQAILSAQNLAALNQ